MRCAPSRSSSRAAATSAWGRTATCSSPRSRPSARSRAKPRRATRSGNHFPGRTPWPSLSVVKFSAWRSSSVPGTSSTGTRFHLVATPISGRCSSSSRTIVPTSSASRSSLSGASSMWGNGAEYRRFPSWRGLRAFPAGSGGSSPGYITASSARRSSAKRTRSSSTQCGSGPTTSDGRGSATAGGSRAPTRRSRRRSASSSRISTRARALLRPTVEVDRARIPFARGARARGEVVVARRRLQPREPAPRRLFGARPGNRPDPSSAAQRPRKPLIWEPALRERAGTCSPTTLRSS